MIAASSRLCLNPGRLGAHLSRRSDRFSGDAAVGEGCSSAIAGQERE